MTVSPSSVVGGTGVTGTVELSFAAPAGGAVVGLSSSLASVSVPGTATIAEGTTSTTFALTTSPVATEETATIAAIYAGGTRTTTLAVTPPPPCALRTAGAQWIAFSSKRTGVYDIYAMRADGTCLTQVTNDAADDLFATWSPAGTIAYMSARSGRMQIYVRDFTSGDERLLDVGDLTATSPAFSPDGTRVAFEGYAPGVTAVSDVYVVPAAGGVPVKLTTGQKYSAGPAWSPDGSTVYFVSNRVSGYNVWTVPAAGGAETLVPGTAGILGRPVATPDGTGIAFTLPAAGAAFSKVVLLSISTGSGPNGQQPVRRGTHARPHRLPDGRNVVPRRKRRRVAPRRGHGRRGPSADGRPGDRRRGRFRPVPLNRLPSGRPGRGQRVFSPLPGALKWGHGARTCERLLSSSEGVQ